MKYITDYYHYILMNIKLKQLVVSEALVGNTIYDH